MQVIHYTCDECQKEIAVLREGDSCVPGYTIIAPIEIERWGLDGRHELFSSRARRLCSPACVRKALESLARKVEAGDMISAPPKRDEAAIAFAAGMGGLIPDGSE
jgi:hypothetical protein